MKKNLLIICLLYSFSIFGQGTEKTSQNNDIIENFMRLSTQQLFDTAEYYRKKFIYDTALIYFNLIINTPIKDSDIEQQKITIMALNQSAITYGKICDYRTSYELFIKALTLSEKTGNILYKPSIYNNLGVIYNYFNRLDIAKEFFTKALNLCEDSIRMAVYLNNLGDNAIKTDKIDSAFYYLNKSFQISKQHNDIYLEMILNSIAESYQKNKLYDSAFHYFGLSQNEARKKDRTDLESEFLSKSGKLFFEVNNIDSALHYINLSNIIAIEKKFSGILADNYLLLSKIEESKGSSKSAFEYFKFYANLKDSIYSIDKFSEINQLQRLYEISKTNQQIEELLIDRQLKENTIHYQRIVQWIVIIAILLLIIVLLIVIYQHRALRKSYKILFNKNVDIIKNNKKTSEKDKIPDDYEDLMKKILAVMEDPAIYCDQSFSADKLASLTQSNHSYVSTAIKNTLNKNFRSFLSSYRIREAQRIFSEFDTEKYSIEFISQKVGFKSRSGFFDAFKEVTGVSPSYYLKSLKEKIS